MSNENDQPASNPESSHRPIRSYVIRAGRLTDSQRKALDSHWQDFVIPFEQQLLQPEQIFPQPGKLVVEIGFGMGDSLLEMARATPTSNFIGIEVHRPGVGKLLHGIVEHELKNLKIICHDATEVMAHCFAENSLSRVLILFPDPWPKKRHQKRRIVQPGFIELIRTRLQPGATIHLATDWQEYAEVMLEVMQSVKGLSNQMGPDNYWEDPERPDTKFEKRGRRLGHGVWDLLFAKQD